MINSLSCIAIQEAQSGAFCKPLYNSYCFSRIPGTIWHLFGNRDHLSLPLDVLIDPSKIYDDVVFFLLDGFGWNTFEQYFDTHSFLQRFSKGTGLASQITSQFPSTTAAHVTSLNTGLPVGQTGIYEWFYYEPKVDEVIAPLLFSYAGDREEGTLDKTLFPPSEIFPFKTIYQDLAKEGVQSHLIMPQNIASSTYSQALSTGAEIIPYEFFSDGIDKLIQMLKIDSDSHRYFYLYFGDIDSAGHRHGLQSQAYQMAVEYCFKVLEEIFMAHCPNKRKTACFLAADHGMTAVDPKTTLYLNVFFPEILESIKRNQKGNLIVPAGSCRDFFLHIKHEELFSIEQTLKNHLKGKAEIRLVEELVKDQYFGECSNRLLERVGNLVILPFANEAVWWLEKYRFEQHFYGAHGGLTPEEMKSIFLFLDLNEC
jgi:predicted AlkP superfamily pyrophosphatase or phosphodiesterase